MGLGLIIKAPGILNGLANLTKARALAEQAGQKRDRLAGRVAKAQNVTKDKKGG
jgi:hypothetical protein